MGRTRKEKVGPRSRALSLYNLRKSQALEGTLPELRRRKAVNFEELSQDYFRSLRVDGRSEYHAKFRWENHLKPVFDALNPTQVTSTRIKAYVDARQMAGAANATINRELAQLRRMYNLAFKSDPPKVLRVPRIPRLKENPPRKGFVPDDVYDKLAEQSGKVGLWMRAIFECAYLYGWRRNELLNLKVEQVDITNCTIRLWAGETKNGQGRVVRMVRGGKVFHLLTACIAGKRPMDYIFTREDGNRIKDFRAVWWNVCTAAGLGKVEDCTYTGLLFHDMRRTAIRNMVRRGIPQKVAMLISGHKTPSVFERYNIVDESDLELAAAKMEAGTNCPKTAPAPKYEEVATHAEMT